MTIQTVAGKYLTHAPIRDVTEEINAFLDDTDKISHQTPHNWIVGARRPRRLLMVFLKGAATGWVREFAVEMLAALKENGHG